MSFCACHSPTLPAFTSRNRYNLEYVFVREFGWNEVLRVHQRQTLLFLRHAIPKFTETVHSTLPQHMQQTCLSADDAHIDSHYLAGHGRGKQSGVIPSRPTSSSDPSLTPSSSSSSAWCASHTSSPSQPLKEPSTGI